MPLQATSGAASYDAFGGGVPVEPVYIEQIFSTWLYTGTGSTLTITNGIDLSTKGGLVWCKWRNDVVSHLLFDTVRGATKYISSDTTDAQSTISGVTSFNSNGFSIGSYSGMNNSGSPNVSWTFREQPKFFDVVTYTGTGSNRTIAHALGSVPGCIMVKRTDTSGAWQVYHRNLANTDYLVLNTTAASATGATRWNSTTPTSTEFSLGTDATVNSSAAGATYVAYLFAHDAGGFGLTGTDNVISCGSFTTDGSGNATVSLGYEPQWIVIKKSSDTGDWDILDTMRGWVVGGVDANLKPNTSAAESAGFDRLNPTATGFVSAAGALSASQPYIYIAIRRGPMKVPTTGTSVFSPIFSTAAYNTALTTNFPVDMQIEGYPPSDTLNMSINDRLRGVSTTATQKTVILTTSSTAAEASPNATMTNNWDNTGFKMPQYYGSSSYISWNFRRAPSFFDEVCYTGNGVTGRAITHNLTVSPELIILKSRSQTGPYWNVYSATLGAGKNIQLNDTGAATTDSGYWNNTAPTATTFTVGSYGAMNNNGSTFVAYLFATCAGVSKVGTYNGSGALQTVNCGFTSGARFVLIKRTDSTGDWWTYDSARGISSGNDPYLFLNSTAAEVTNTNYVDTDTTGFKVTAAAPAGLNASGGTYIFLAIA